MANRQTWTITGIGQDGSLILHGPDRHVRDQTIPAEYVRESVELAYATTVHGAQGDTVARAHFALGETTGAAAAYVAMTRGRQTNTVHLVADDLDQARRQWVETFNRDRADLGPAHARTRAIEDIDRYGPLSQSGYPAVPDADSPRSHRPRAAPKAPESGSEKTPI